MKIARLWETKLIADHSTTIVNKFNRINDE